MASASLFQKLGHALPAVRERTLENISFKLSTGLLQIDELRETLLLLGGEARLRQLRLERAQPVPMRDAMPVPQHPLKGAEARHATSGVHILRERRLKAGALGEVVEPFLLVDAAISVRVHRRDHLLHTLELGALRHS